MRRAASVVVMVVAGLLLAACGGTGGDSGGEAFEASFARQPWPGLTVKTAVAQQILEDAGYTVEVAEIPVPATAEALKTGDVDAYLGNWWPSQEPTFEDVLAGESVQVVGTNLEGTTYRPAVPAYVTEELGIDSLAELDEHGDRFGRRFLGIEAGAPGNEYIQNAIDEDAYGLGDWGLVTSSTAAMLAEVGKAIEANEPVVFLGWKPHWMSITWDLTFLEDPNDVWPGAGEVRTLATADVAEEKPNLHRFLDQFQVPLETQSQWILKVGRQDQRAEQVAQEWIAANPDTVRGWLEGVQTADGDPAGETVLSAATSG